MDSIAPEPHRVTKTCPQCGVAFTVPSRLATKRTYCSRECQNASYKTRYRIPRDPSPCVICGNLITQTRERVRQTCSTTCQSALRRRQKEHIFAMRSCVACGLRFHANSSSGRVTCSPECSRRYKSLRQRGELSHRWLGGLTSPDWIARNSIDYTDWRSAVLRRDRGVCCDCGNKPEHPHVHHIRNLKKYPDLAFAVDNGIVLCSSCHVKLNAHEEEHIERLEEIVRSRS